MRETAALSGREQNISACVIALACALPLGLLYYFFTDAPVLSVMLGTFLVLWSAFSVLKDLEHKEAIIVLALLAVKFALTAYQALYKNLPLGGEDWGNYHFGAITITEKYSGVFEILFKSSSDLFTKLVAVIYSVFGAHTRQINQYILAGSFVAARYVFKTAMLLTERSYYYSSLCTIVFLVWPIDIIYSVTYLREMPVQMLVIVSFYCFVCFMKSRRPLYLVLSLVWISFACMMHSGVVGILFVYIVFMMLHESSKPSEIFSARNLVLAAVVIAALVVSPFWSSISAKIGDINSVDSLVERAQQFTEGMASTRYISDMPENFLQFIIQTPYRAILFAFVPLPWMINSFDTAISWVLDAVPQFWIIYRIAGLLKLSKMKSRKDRLYAVIFVLCVVMTYIVCGMGTTAYGNAIRHRAKILPLVLVFVVGVYGYLRKGGEKYAAEHYRSGI